MNRIANKACLVSCTGRLLTCVKKEMQKSWFYDNCHTGVNMKQGGYSTEVMIKQDDYNIQVTIKLDDCNNEITIKQGDYTAEVMIK